MNKAEFGQGDLEDLYTNKVFEEARARIVRWVSLTFIVGTISVILAGFFGLTTFRDYLNNLDSTLDAKVKANLAENFKSRSDDIIESSAEAKSEIKSVVKEVAGLQLQAKAIEEKLASFNKKLAELETQASQKANEFMSRIDQKTAEFETPQQEQIQVLQQSKFEARSREYAKSLNLDLPEPKMSFGELTDRLRASYDPRTGIYTVSPAHVGETGFAEHAGVMSRFFENNRTLIPFIGSAEFPEQSFWHDFRQSMVKYLLVSEKLIGEDVSYIDQKLTLYSKLKLLESVTDTPSVRKLCIALLKEFDRAWNTSNVNGQVIAVNQKINAVPSDKLRSVFK